MIDKVIHHITHTKDTKCVQRVFQHVVSFSATAATSVLVVKKNGYVYCMGVQPVQRLCGRACRATGTVCFAHGALSVGGRCICGGGRMWKQTWLLLGWRAAGWMCSFRPVPHSVLIPMLCTSAPPFPTHVRKQMSSTLAFPMHASCCPLPHPSYSSSLTICTHHNQTI